MFKIRRKEIKAGVGKYFMYGSKVYKIVEIKENRNLTLAYRQTSDRKIRNFPYTVTDENWEEYINKGSLRTI